MFLILSPNLSSETAPTNTPSITKHAEESG